ncbi:MAG TPA: hypothetical protein VIV40_14805 [Kofleriaceae bacterium]
MRRLLGLVALAVCAAIGCTAEVPGTEGRHGEQDMGSGNSGGGDQTSMTLTTYFDKIAAVHCEQAFSCRDSFPPEQGVFEDTWGASVTACEANLIAAWNPKQVETEIAKGRITYDGSAAVTCLEGVTFAACPDYWNRGIEWAESCYHVVVGTVPVGGACENNYSCTTYYCDSVMHTCQ